MSERLFDLGELADPASVTNPMSTDRLDESLMLRLYRSMSLIRACESAIGAMIETGEVRCPCHLAIGQEAVPAAVGALLNSDDRVFGAHRSHGYFLALGGSPHRLIAEVLGRTTGCSHGLGGSMHLRDGEIGLEATVPIVGATIPIAVGAGLASKMAGDGSIAVASFGDGAAEEGVFHESLNFAAVHRIPVLFLCENNLFSSHLHISERQAFSAISRYGPVHGVESFVLDGNDVGALVTRFAEVLPLIRSGRPVLVEAVTYRWRGHVGASEDLDVGVMRDSQLPAWKLKDPIQRLRTAMAAYGVHGSKLDDLDQQVNEEVLDAQRTARADPWPESVSDLLGSVYCQ